MRLQRQLESLPAEVQKLLSSDLVQIQRLLRHVQGSDYDAFYLQRLKAAERELYQLIEDVPQKLNELHVRAGRKRPETPLTISSSGCS